MSDKIIPGTILYLRKGESKEQRYEGWVLWIGTDSGTCYNSVSNNVRKIKQDWRLGNEYIPNLQSWLELGWKVLE